MKNVWGVIKFALSKESATKNRWHEESRPAKLVFSHPRLLLLLDAKENGSIDRYQEWGQEVLMY